LPIIAHDGPVAARHAVERARLSNEGRTLSFVDGRIAATAVVHGLVLVTRNVRDFELFEDLAIENWFEA
jgi:tRNA(fMet)-specific endonuclease VapC